MPLTVARNAANLSDADVEKVDEYMLDGYLQAAPHLFRLQARPILEGFVEILNAAFGKK